jgi:hypothetical protein
MLRILTILLITFCTAIYANDPQDVDPNENSLNLEALAEMFSEAETLEAFEQSLNDPTNGLNNLDLDEDGKADFIRVMADVKEDAHLITLQVPTDSNDVQDVATIAVEKDEADKVEVQIQGDATIYGQNSYVVPAAGIVTSWVIIRHLYVPRYRPYRSAYLFGYYPGWWKPYPIIKRKLYRQRIKRYYKAKRFVWAKKPRLYTHKKMKYKARTANKLKKRNAVKKVRRKGIRNNKIKRKARRNRNR